METRTKNREMITISTRKKTVISINSMNMRTTSKTTRKKKKNLKINRKKTLMTFLIWIKMKMKMNHLKEKVNLRLESDTQKGSFKMKKRGCLIRKIILMKIFNINLCLKNKIKTSLMIILRKNKAKWISCLNFNNRKYLIKISSRKMILKILNKKKKTNSKIY